MKKLIFPALLFLLALYFSLTWLSPGKYLGGGDVGIPMLFPSRSLGLVSGPWWDTQDTGTTNPLTYTAVPFYFVLSQLEKLEIGPAVAQRLFFLIIIFIGSISIYFISIGQNIGIIYSGIASLFYVLNVYSLSVWHRGVHNGMLFLLLAPFSLLLLTRGVEKRKYAYLILIAVLSFCLSYVYGSPAFVYSIWFIWAVYLLSSYFVCDKKADRRFILNYFILLLAIWTLTNLWWLLHFILTGRYVFGQFNANEVRQRSSDVLVALRSQTDLSYVFRGLNKYLFYEVKEWGNFYKNPVIIFLTWVPTLIVFSTSVFGSNYKSKIWKFFFLLTILVVFISKGVNAPLGSLVKYLYDHLYFLLLLRNPYEKTGILLTVTYSYLFALGFKQVCTLIGKYSKTAKFLIGSIILISSFVVLVWPMWTSQTFAGLANKSEISIPDFYFQADVYLKGIKGDTRILHLPLPPGEAVNYDWGYSGIEPSQLLFEGSSISYVPGIPSLDLRVRDLSELIHNRDTANIEKAFSTLNIGWVVVHNEVDWKSRDMESPLKVNEWLSEKPYFLEKSKVFGPLSLYKVKDEYLQGHVYSPKSVSVIGLGYRKTIGHFWDEVSTDDMFVIPSESESDIAVSVYENKNSVVLSPVREIAYQGLPKIETDNALKELLYVRHLPGSFLYPIVKLKEKITEASLEGNYMTYCIDMSGKRLVESVFLASEMKIELSKKNLEIYKESLNRCSNYYGINLEEYVLSQKGYKEVSEKFARHVSVLDHDFEDGLLTHEVYLARKYLTDFMVGEGIIPRNLPKNVDDEHEVRIFSFNVGASGIYEIIIPTNNLPLNNIDLKITQIDSVTESIDVDNRNNGNMSFGERYFDSGVHEIHITSLKLPIRVFTPSDVEISSGVEFLKEINDQNSYSIFRLLSEDNPTQLVHHLDNLDYRESYEISFENFVVRGSDFRLLVIQDSDPVDNKNQIIPEIEYLIGAEIYDHFWQKQTVRYRPTINAGSADVVIIARPWNNCRNFFDEEDCLHNNLYKEYERPTELQIKNLRIRKSMTYEPQLNMIVENESHLGTFQHILTKLSSSVYRLNLIEQKPPYVIVFSETMHPLWKITDDQGRDMVLKHFTANGFANAWYVDNVLPESIFIRYDLQFAATYGIIISAVAFLIFSFVLIRKDNK